MSFSGLRISDFSAELEGDLVQSFENGLGIVQLVQTIQIRLVTMRREYFIGYLFI